MIRLGGLVNQKAFGKFEQGKVVSNPMHTAFIKEAEGEDHEVSMAQNSLDTIIKMATELKAKMGENEKDIPAWIQDHITNAENFISQASSNYHEYGTNESVIKEEVKDWDTIHNVFVKFLKANTKELEKRVLSKDEDATKKAIKSIVSGLTNAQRSLKMESVNENLDNYSKDAITDMIINLSRYEGTEELIADLKKILKQRTLGKLKKEQSVKESKINEMGPNDVHFKQVMSFYDKGSSSTKKAVSIFVSGKMNANRNQIADDLGDMGYNEILDVVDHFKLDEADVKYSKTITKAEWDKQHKDYKSIIKGVHYMLMNDPKYGTVLAPVKVEGSISLKKMMKEASKKIKI
jgi:cell pole-organizing protein PopZ